NETQLAHWLHASVSDVLFSQLMVFARIRAQVVLPTPRGPQNKKACANWLLAIAFFKVVVMCSCPTTALKFCGRYLRAETINFSMRTIFSDGFKFTLISGAAKMLCSC